jgi:carbonic anhydrase
MASTKELFENNIKWAEKIKAEDPLFFHRLAQQQSPEYLWIGCSDSRVPANEIVGLLPGEIFVHRNVANMVIHTDLNCLSVLHYAVEVLQVKHIIVCGHYGCGGVVAALRSERFGLIDNWLRHIKDIFFRYQEGFEACVDEDERVDLMCEYNVVEQVANVCHTTIVQDAWRRGQELSVHGWIYSIRDGVLRDLNVSFDAPEQVPEVYRQYPTAGRR